MPGRGKPVIDFHQKTDIDVFMLRAAMTGRDAVDIEVENPAIDQAYVPGIDPAFLRGFTQCDRHDIGLAIGMPSRLKPLIVFAVVHQQHP